MTTIAGQLKSGFTNASPTIECWIPDQNPRGIGVLIFPGGGYGGLSEHEGRGYAEYFSRAGIACFVVAYRLGSRGFRHPAMLEDALAAIYSVRKEACRFRVDPRHLGIMGSSAGGHLAAHALVAWTKYESDISLRPDFGVLCYPVITSQGPYAHLGSIRNLAGNTPSPALLDELACEKQVSSHTPPCFLWHTGEDEVVPLENTFLFAEALREQRIPFEMHIYPEGRHGLGLDTPFDWGAECLRWIHATAQQPGAGDASRRD